MANHPALLDLRGHFSDPLAPERDQELKYRLNGIVDVFPITDEYAVIVSQDSVNLLNLPKQEILWSILTHQPLFASALDINHSLLALALAEQITLWDLHSGRVAHRFDMNTDRVTYLTFSPDGTLMAVAPYQDGVQLWDLATGHVLQTLVDKDHPSHGTAKSMAFSPEGQFLAVGYQEGRHVWLWHIVDGQLLRIMEEDPLTARIYGLAFSPDGSFLVGSDFNSDPEEEQIDVWEVASGKLIEGFARQGWLPTFSLNGQYIAATSMLFSPGKISYILDVWDFAKRRLLWSNDVHTNSVRQLAFTPDGKFLISVSEDNTARWWNATDGREVYRLETTPNVIKGERKFSGIFTQDASFLALVATDGKFRFWNTDGTLLSTSHISPLEGIAVQSRERVASWEYSPFHATFLYILHPNHTVIQRLKFPFHLVQCAVFSPDSEFIIVGLIHEKTKEATVAICHIASQKVLQTFIGHTDRILCVACHPDGEIIASGAEDCTIRLWEKQTGRLYHVLQGHTQNITCLAFSPDGNMLISGSEDKTVRVWEIATGRLLYSLEGHKNGIVNVAFNSDGQYIATVDQDQYVRLWKRDGKTFVFKTGSEPLTLIAHRASSLTGEPLSPILQQEGLHFWTFTSEGDMYQLAQENTQVLDIAFQENNSLIVSGYNCGGIRIWDLGRVDLSKI